jgi:hypothetical protein
MLAGPLIAYNIHLACVTWNGMEQNHTSSFMLEAPQMVSEFQISSQTMEF